MLICCLPLLLAGCAAPAVRFDETARAMGLQRSQVEGAGFDLSVFAVPGRPADGELHVYFDGDGTPWLHGSWPAADPTPRDPLVLEMMRRDPGSLYLSRPCYDGMGPRARCTPALWTRARYGETVAASMAAALRRLLKTHHARRVVLIGYSGGGVLAMLVAARVAAVDRVITVAANLDVAAWTALHHYLPLDESLDPATLPPLPARIRQVHYAGGRDRNVPPDTVRGVIERQTDARLRVIRRYEHGCCWAQNWTELLRRAGVSPGRE